MSKHKTLADVARRAINRWNKKPTGSTDLISEERLSAPCKLPRAVAPWGPMSDRGGYGGPYAN